MTTEQRYLFVSDPELRGSHLARFRLPWSPPGLEECALFAAAFERPRSNPIRCFDGVVLAYRDDLRGGWHVVPEGTRYVAVRGIKARQRCAPFSSIARGHAVLDIARRMHEGKDVARLWAWYEHGEADRDDPDGWCILDLHDLGSLPVAQRPRLEPADPPSLSSSVGTRTDLTIEDMANAFRRFKDLNLTHVRQYASRVHIDEDNGQAFSWQREAVAPTDAEVVKAWEAYMLEREAAINAGHPLFDVGQLVVVGTWTEYQVARARELKRLHVEARERERLAVVVEDQYEP